jgi:DnaJ-class molecular chaperone
VEVRVVTPRKLTPKQRELLQELARTLETDTGDSRGIFDRLRDALS